MKGLAQNSKDKYGLSTYNNADGCFQYFKINKLTLHECSGKENKDRTLLIRSIFFTEEHTCIGGKLLRGWVKVAVLYLQKTVDSFKIENNDFVLFITFLSSMHIRPIVDHLSKIKVIQFQFKFNSSALICLNFTKKCFSEIQFKYFKHRNVIQDIQSDSSIEH